MAPYAHGVLGILAVVGPLYLLMALGWATVRLQLFRAQDVPVLSRYVMYIALPALLISSLGTQDLAAVLNPTYLLVFAAAAMLSQATGFTIARRAWRTDRTGAAYVGMGSSVPNTGFIGIPVLIAVEPQYAAAVVAMNFVVENVLITPTALVLAESGASTGSGAAALRATAGAIIRNPVLVSVAVGIALALLPVTLPGTATDTLDLLAATTGPVALVYVGAALAGIRVRSAIPRAATIAVLKLVWQPALALGLLLAATAVGMAGLEPGMRTGLVVTAAAPMFTVWTIFAARHGKGDLANASLLVTTVASFVTLTGWLLVAEQLPAGWGA